MKRILIVGLLLNILLFGCEQAKQTPFFEDVSFEDSYINLGDSVNINFKIKNPSPLSFNPRIEVDLNTDCFSTFSGTNLASIATQGGIASDTRIYSLSLDRITSEKCENTDQTVVVKLLDSVGNNVLDSKTLKLTIKQ